MNKLIPNSDSLPVPAHNVHEAFPPAKKKAAAPVPPEDEEPVEDEDDEFEDEDEDAPDEDAPDDEDDDEPVEDEEEDEDEDEPEQSATVKVTVTAAPAKKKKPTRPARGFTEAAMDAVVESYIRPLREYTTKGGKHVEIHSPKWKRCVEHVKQRGDVDNAYAVCTSSIGAGGSLKKGHGGSA